MDNNMNNSMDKNKIMMNNNNKRECINNKSMIKALLTGVGSRKGRARYNNKDRMMMRSNNNNNNNINKFKKR